MSLVDKIAAQLRRDEGLKLTAYRDTRGFLTIGYGRLIDSRKGGGITAEEALHLLSNDIALRQRLILHHLPWSATLDEARQGVLLNMAFQLGVPGLLRFKRMLRACADQHFADAAEEMRQSEWAKQTPQRCRRLATQMETGEWQ